ncbi:hypothetical protein CcaverHIS002_0600470 [Cutaneotrichosporon cavernicola]|uniref:Uncharacterized protein n=1 Tax=Cutaneotrichosporon cavernicola TaxID=279322 RepID=A0AA48L5R7_9TREE|nr:uncharacterized protein CcaverHIS019_0500560 [Cutaneotrichosporon cavernicola]BEI85760.1 hypothetical protein CcaverHIS002_0600470 [Cutaneotrichosporon cavernicola]BEI92428.1 hypothetical protein CcaverHIS019_0500560 [Cutaneotrichosporon cavernicola]BEJ00201.1 hypothetical protein CcaverHIS631_0500580 [Cutaneotrichosporon cavernicola]BEJ07972.1 hypothetical protein CcaverHIS641_0500570 [Cutaneotrichosporon cavernicola]
MGGERPPADGASPHPPTLRVFPSLPSSGSSSRADNEKNDTTAESHNKSKGKSKSKGNDTDAPANDDSEWSSIFGGLSSAIDDAAMNISSPPPPSASSDGPSTGFLALPEYVHQKRKRTRSHKRSLSVGAEPNFFGSPGSLLPLRLDPAEEPLHGQHIPMRAISGFHPHLYTLRLSSSRSAKEPSPQHPGGLLASPIHLGKVTERPPSPLELASEPKTAPHSEPGPTSSRAIEFPGADSPPSPDNPDNHLASSPSDSPGSWLRSPTTNRTRFRSDGSDVDAIMFTPRQLDFEGDDGPLVTGRRLQWNPFDIGDSDRPSTSSLPGALQGGFQSMALGPAFEPSECSRPTEPLSPAFALETEPGVSKS